MAKPIEVIERIAKESARSSDVLSFAIEGLLERTVLDDPTSRGIVIFHQSAETVLTTGHEIITAKITAGQDALKAHLSDSERARFEQHDALDESHGDAGTAIWGAFQQIRIAYIKQLRTIIAVRQQGVKVLQPKVMNRGGRRWQLADFVYLTVRQALMDRYNETKMELMVAQGVEQFTLDTEKSELIGRPFAVKDYPDIATEYLHPRSNNLVGGPYVSP